VLLQLTPDQITKFWDTIEEAINESVPIYAQGIAVELRNRNIHEALLLGKMQAWAGFGLVEDRPALVGLVVTTIEEDPCSRVTNLSIYSLYGVENIDRKIYEDGLATLRKFAQGSGCSRILAITDNPRVIQLIRMMGGETRYVLATLDIEPVGAAAKRNGQAVVAG
jgi:hypothetical protein